MRESLLTILSAFGCSQIPTPGTLPQVLAQVAKFVFQSTPMIAIMEINSGIPKAHCFGLRKKLKIHMYALYQCVSVTPAKVLALLDEPIFMNKAESVVYRYLRPFIGNMSLEQVRVFLRFVSGSSVCTAEKLEVQFNSLAGRTFSSPNSPHVQ